MAVDRNMRVLVVDDYQTMRRITGNFLRQLNFVNIDEASDGTDALTKLGLQKYGLVISDWNMEPMTGIELLRKVRANPQLRSIPFVMVTAENTKENVMTAKEAGVSNYIVKPFTLEILHKKLASVLGAF